MGNVCEEEGRRRKRIDERSRERERGRGRVERERVGDAGITDVSIPRAIRPGVSGASTVRAPPSTTSTTLITRRWSMRPQAPEARPKIAPPRRSYTRAIVVSGILNYSPVLICRCVSQKCSRIPICCFPICPRSPLLRFYTEIFKKVSPFERFPINILISVIKI